MKRLIILPLLLMTLSMGATKIYVATTGNDGTGDGTSGNPYLTIATGIANASAGDTVFVRAGTYNVSTQIVLPVQVSLMGDGETSIITTGAALNPMILAESPTEGTAGNQSISYLKLDGNNLTALKAINFRCRSNVSIHHCTIVDFLNYGVGFWGQASGIEATTYATGNSFHHNIMTNCASYQTGAGSNPCLNVTSQTGFLIYSNYIEQSGRDPVTTNGQCIKAGPVKGLKIYDNILKGDVRNDRAAADNMQWCIEIWSQTTSEGTEIFDNKIYYSGVDFAGTGSIKGDYDFGVSLHDNWIGCPTLTAQKKYAVTIEGQGVGVNEILIYRNHFENMGTTIILNKYVGSTYKNIKVYNNIANNIGVANAGWNGSYFFSSNDDVVCNVDSLFFDNNVIVGTSYQGALEAGGFNLPNYANVSVGSIFIRNNIIGNFYYYGIRAENRGQIDALYAQNNIIYNVDTEISLAITPTLVVGVSPQTNIYSDPLFKSNETFRLRPTSPAIDAGIDVGLTTDYWGHRIPQGSAPDIGATEYGNYVLFYNGKQLY